MVEIPDDIDPTALRVVAYSSRLAPGEASPLPAPWSDHTLPIFVSDVVLRRMQARLGCGEDEAAVALREEAARTGQPSAAGVPYVMLAAVVEVDDREEFTGVLVLAPEEQAIYPRLIEQFQCAWESSWRRAASGRARA